MFFLYSACLRYLEKYFNKSIPVLQYFFVKIIISNCRFVSDYACEARGVMLQFKNGFAFKDMRRLRPIIKTADAFAFRRAGKL